MQFSLPSYFGDFNIEVPSEVEVQVLSPRKVKVKSSIDVIDQAFKNPIDGLSLEKVIKEKNVQSVCIICEDITRHSPTQIIIPRLLDYLNSLNIDDAKIYIVMALGTHRFMSDDEIINKIGKESYNRVKVYNSEFFDKSKQVYLGDYNKIPLYLDKKVADADLRIGVGSVVPHPVAGWSGGAKIVIPGVTGKETVEQFHISSHLFERNMYGQDITPSREIMEVLVAQIGLDWVVDTVYTPDNEVYAAFCGDFIKVQRAASCKGKEVYGVKAKRKSNLVIVSSHPADGDYWQAGKGIHSGEIVTNDGGEIVLVTHCPEGIGPHKQLPFLFERALTNWDSLLSDCQNGLIDDVIGASSALMRVKTILRYKKLSLVSDGLNYEEMKKLGFTCYKTVEEAINNYLEKKNCDKHITIITHGASIVPILEE